MRRSAIDFYSFLLQGGYGMETTLTVCEIQGFKVTATLRRYKRRKTIRYNIRNHRGVIVSRDYGNVWEAMRKLSDIQNNT